MLDPDRDYAQVERTLWPQPWIIPLTEPLRHEPWSVPLEEWEQHVVTPTPAQMIEPVTSPIDKEKSVIPDQP
jgi:hypothetical protein